MIGVAKPCLGGNMAQRKKDKKHGVGAGVGTMERQKVVPPSKYKIVIHNDDYTPFEDVEYILIQVFYKSEQQARALAMSVHKAGKGIAGVYSKEVAEMKLIQAMDLAKQFEHPLLLTMEEE